MLVSEIDTQQEKGCMGDPVHWKYVLVLYLLHVQNCVYINLVFTHIDMPTQFILNLMLPNCTN